MFDELKIFITGDTAGIESTMKRALNVVKGGIGQMNAQEVDWTAIFSRAVSPAIISGVASVFAYAISQAVNFQSAMAMTGTAAGDSSAQIAQLSQSALGLSTQVPSSAEDVAAAMTQVQTIFGKNTAATKDVTLAMAQLAEAGFGDLNDIVKASMDVFQQWGVTTEGQALQALTDLMHGAEATANHSIPMLADSLAQFSPQLREAGIKFSAFKDIVSGFAAMVQTVGLPQASALYKAIADGASMADPALASFAGGADAIKKSLVTDGGIGAIESLAKTMTSQFGDNIGLIGSNLHITATGAEGLINALAKAPELKKNFQDVVSNAGSIGDAAKKADVGTNKLLTDWNKVKESFLDSSFWQSVAKNFVDFAGNVTAGVGVVNGWLDSVHKSGLDTKIAAGVMGAVVGNLGQAGSAIGLAGGGAAGALGVSSPSGLDQLNKMLGSSGVGFSSDALSRIDKTASETGMIDALMSALKTGGKGDQYASTITTFNLTLPQSAAGWSSKDMAQALYNRFQGTQ